MNAALLDDLLAACEYYRICTAYRKIGEHFRYRKATCALRYEKMKRKKLSPLPLNLFCGVWVVLLPALSPLMRAVFASESFSEACRPLLALCVGIIIVNTVACRLLCAKYRRDAARFFRNTLQPLQRSADAVLAEADAELRAFHEANRQVAQLLPAACRSEAAAHWMAEAVADGRAATLHEAVALYGQHLSVWQPQQLTQELLRPDTCRRARRAGRPLCGVDKLTLYRHYFPNPEINEIRE